MKKIKGLSLYEAKKRLEKYGKNEITRTEKVSPWKILFAQFASPLILMLIGAVIISLFIGVVPGGEFSFTDTFLILIIVLLCVFSGFFQEYKAEKTIEALQKMSTPMAKVIRDGNEKVIPATELVPGDIIILNDGDIIPADAKLLKANNLKTDESILTGESRDLGKKVYDEIFMSTFITVGNGIAEVTNTGMNSRVGKIADKLQKIEERKTPFQVELSKLSKKIFWLIAAIIIIIASVGYFRYGAYLALLVAISLAVAAIPEGLPAIVTLALSLGAKTMSKKNALLRKLSTVESSGSVNIICTDKTGTLTMDELTVRKIFFNNKITNIEDVKKPNLLLECGVLCNNTRKAYEKNKEYYIGDQTEVALTVAGEKFRIIKDFIEAKNARIKEIPFTPKRKMMTVYMKDGFVFSKGAPELILNNCNKIHLRGKDVVLTKKLRKRILNQYNKFATEGLRVLGFAYKKSKDSKNLESNLIWLGLQAMSDPPRPEVKEAIRECYTAGIRVIMITGDHAFTAQAIAKEIGLQSKGAVSGEDLDEMNESQIKKKLKKGINIFARTSPEHKLRILEILQEDNEVAMTGDGVNDSLALKKADVGIAMGVKGTEVAREASDMILMDDNFASIVNAIREGRRIFDNIRKFVNYLFTCNIAEVGVLFIATLFLALKEPILLPVQILWINLLTDGMPALALGVDPAAPNIMKRKPRKVGEPIINRQLVTIIISIGIQKTIILFAVFFFTLPFGSHVARTALFTGFILYEFIRIGVIRYQEKMSLFVNKWLILALILSLAAQLIIIYSPLNSLFNIVPLGLMPWIVLMVGFVVALSLSILMTEVIVRYYNKKAY
ncbi:MAG: calcium-translocating P-type ATPase, PMCA-type [Candidatus Woesearchaeota archaeon]|nr:MAG: calcium-translocating P-type ATPase, PMCA-type [Candidatus Woesearchaeota archaeon]